MNNPVPPNFSDWIFVSKESLIVIEEEKSKLYTKEFSDTDDVVIENSWLGFVEVFQNKEGTALGKTFNIFGRGVIIKIWKLLEDEEKSHWFAISNKRGRWRCFSSKRHQLRITYIEHPNRLGRVYAAIIFATPHGSEDVAVKVKIMRD